MSCQSKPDPLIVIECSDTLLVPRVRTLGKPQHLIVHAVVVVEEAVADSEQGSDFWRIKGIDVRAGLVAACALAQMAVNAMNAVKHAARRSAKYIIFPLKK